MSSHSKDLPQPNTPHTYCPKGLQAQSDPEPPPSLSRDPPSPSPHIPAPLPRTLRTPGPAPAAAALHRDASQPFPACRALPYPAPRGPAPASPVPRTSSTSRSTGPPTSTSSTAAILPRPPSGQLLPPPPANHRASRRTLGQSLGAALPRRPIRRGEGWNSCQTRHFGRIKAVSCHSRGTAPGSAPAAGRVTLLAAPAASHRGAGSASTAGPLPAPFRRRRAPFRKGRRCLPSSARAGP